MKICILVLNIALDRNDKLLYTFYNWYFKYKIDTLNYEIFIQKYNRKTEYNYIVLILNYYNCLKTKI